LTTLKLITIKTTTKLQNLLTEDDREEASGLPTLKTVQRLNEVATKKLAEIIRKHSTGENGWQGYDEAEVIAARELLDRESSDIRR